MPARDERARALVARVDVPRVSVIQKEPPRRTIAPETAREPARVERGPPRSAPASAATAKKRPGPAPRSTTTSMKHSPHDRCVSTDGPTTSTPARHRTGSESRLRKRQALHARRSAAQGTKAAITNEERVSPKVEPSQKVSRSCAQKTAEIGQSAANSNAGKP